MALGWMVAIGAALVAIGARLGAWWRDRAVRVEHARLRAAVDRVTGERDAAAGQAAVATAQTEVWTAHAAAQAAAGVVAEEIHDAAFGANPGDRIVAVDEWVRTHAGASPVPSHPLPGAGARPPVRKR